MRKFLIATLVSVATLSAAGMAAAAGRAGGGPSTGMGTHEATTNSNGLKASDRDLGPQRAADRAGSVSKATANSNGIQSSDRDKGKMRAQDRRHRHHPSSHRK